jgi:ABC-2 type transport system ATP-binding protein
MMLIAEGLVPRPEILATWRPGTGRAGLSGTVLDGDGQMLVASGLAKRYGRRLALDRFDLTVAPGEITGLIGPNGAGKTTFVEIVTGLVRPDAGTVLVGGRDALRSGRAVRRLIGVAPQELALYQTVTVRENVRLFGGLAGLRGRALDAAIWRVLDELALGPVAGKRAGELSGGQRRRVQAATAMVASPPLLLLDEPTAGADPETRSALLAAVRGRAAAGTAVLYTTHYLPELTELNATLALVRAGRVIARGTQEELTGHRRTLDDLYWSLAVPAPEGPVPEGESDAVA